MGSPMTIAWVSPVVLQWVPTIEGTSIPADDKWQEPNRIWQHVRRRLSSSTTLHDREDAIVALRRAIDRRIRHLNEVYRFRSIPGVNRKAKLIDILKDLRIAHPIMFGKLARLRNLIEHNGGTPLDHEICEELVEFS